MFDLVINITGGNSGIWVKNSTLDECLRSAQTIMNIQSELADLTIPQPLADVSAYLVRRQGYQLLAAWTKDNGQAVSVWIVAERKQAVWLVYSGFPPHISTAPKLVLSGNLSPIGIFLPVKKRFANVQDIVCAVDGSVWFKDDLADNVNANNVMWAVYREIDV